MAQKRMFSRQVTESDDFLDLPLPAQCLYFHLSLSADDEGFISSGRRIARAIGAGDSDLEALVNGGFLIFFPEANVYVDKAFCLNNSLRSDRSHPTTFQTERKRLILTENNVYQLISGDVNQMATNCQPDDNQMTTNCQPDDNHLTTNCQPDGNREENRLDQKRKDEKRIDEFSPGEGSSEGGTRSDLLLYMAVQDGIRDELEPVLNRLGLDAAHKAYTQWKAAGGIAGHFRDYATGFPLEKAEQSKTVHRKQPVDQRRNDDAVSRQSPGFRPGSG